MNPRSLVLVTVDCLRADRFGFNGYSRPLTPFLDSLAKESIVLSEAVVAGAPTYFSFPAIMGSRYPLGLGREVAGIAPGEPTIASTLHEAKHETAAFIAGNPYLTARFGYDQGYVHFSDFLNATARDQTTSLRPPVRARWSRLNQSVERFSRLTKFTSAAYNELYFRYCQWRSGRDNLSMDQLRRYPAADVVVSAACAWLQALRAEQFFLWIHLMDPHHPYYPPQEALQSLGISQITPFRARFLNSFWNRFDLSPQRLKRYKQDVMALYDAGVHWVDRQISRLVDALKLHQRWSDTIFVVTADHGEEFLEHGNRYHSPTGLAEELIRVPLLIRAPGISPLGSLHEPFSLIHLAPTLLQALGVDAPPSFRGSGLWKEISSGKAPNYPAIVECVEAYDEPLSMPDRLGRRLMAVRNRDYKLVLHFGEQRDDLYDLQNDPQERQPLPASIQTKERARLLQCARDHLRDERERRDQQLVMRAQLRQIRQSIDLRSSQVAVTRNQGAAKIEHG